MKNRLSIIFAVISVIFMLYNSIRFLEKINYDKFGDVGLILSLTFVIIPIVSAIISVVLILSYRNR